MTTPEAKPATPAEADEIASLIEHFGGEDKFDNLYRLIDGQLAVLHMRAQGLTQLSGVVITVTGFSGRIIADTNVLAQSFIIVGIILVLFAAAICLVRVMPVRWLSSYMDLPQDQWLLIAIRRRTNKTRAFYLASLVFIIGLAFYISSISLMLADPGAAELHRVR